MPQQLPLFDRPDADADTAARAVRLPPLAPLLPALAPLLPAPPLAAIEFVRTPRARRYILRIRPDGSLRVTVPRWGSKREARDFVARQERWIARERDRVLQEHGSRDWHDGSEIWLRGERVRLAVAP